MLKKTSILLIFLLGLSVQAEDIDLVILAGQSNAQGWKGNAAHYPADALDKQIPLWWTSPGISSSEQKWTTLKPQAGRFPKGHFGLEVSLSRDMKNAGKKPAIFKYSLGSTSIAKHWGLSSKKGMWANMIKELSMATTALKKQGHTIRSRTFIWIQGKSDAKRPAMAKAYKNSLSQLIADLRRRTNDNNISIVLGVDEQHAWVKKNPQIVVAQQELAKADKFIQFTSMRGLPKADSTHLTPAGLIEQWETHLSTFRIIN